MHLKTMPDILKISAPNFDYGCMYWEGYAIVILLSHHAFTTGVSPYLHPSRAGACRPGEAALL
jgi:hypothetical protein